MKVSIIVPVYNVEKYLSECIDSVINQTYKHIELVLIDDGSTDGSKKICDETKMVHPDKVIVIHTKNVGPLHARWKGIHKASGDILVFLDSDDCLCVDALEILVKCFEENACDMVLYDAMVCPAFHSKKIEHSFTDGTVFNKKSKEDVYAKLICGQIPNNVCLKAIKANCATLPKHFSEFSNVKHGEDLLLSTQFITNCEKIVYLKQGLYHYRMRLGSAVHSFDFTRKDSIKLVHSELDKFIDIWKMPELKPIHDARKVKGWVLTLKILLENKSCLAENEFKNELKCMAEDPYFQKAYNSMDSSQLSRSYRLLAYCLVKKQYQIIELLCSCMQIVKKIKTGSQHVRAT